LGILVRSGSVGSTDWAKPSSRETFRALGTSWFCPTTTAVRYRALIIKSRKSSAACNGSAFSETGGFHLPLEECCCIFAAGSRSEHIELLRGHMVPRCLSRHDPEQLPELSEFMKSRMSISALVSTLPMSSLDDSLRSPGTESRVGIERLPRQEWHACRKSRRRSHVSTPGRASLYPPCL
jgi:hypothetical protein